jgi:PAS domain S-box-containing protein
MTGRPPAAQQLGLVDQATTRWVEGASRRHPMTLLIMTGVILVGDLLGATVNPRVFAVMAAWFVIAAAEGPWTAAATDFASRRMRYAITLCIDAVMLGAAYYYIDAARIAGIAPFLLIVVSARVVLPTRTSQALAVLVVAVYVTLLVLEVRRTTPLASPVGLAPLTGNEAYLAAAAVSAGAVVWLVLRMQAHVTRTVRDAESRHEAVVQSAADMILVVDDRGHIVEANATALRTSGYTWDELKTLPNAALFPSETWDDVLAMFRRALGGETLARDVRVVTKAGATVWTEATISPVVLGGRPAVVVVARDITERRRQAELLRQNDAKLDLVLKTLNSGFYTIDRDQVITSVRGRGSEAGDATMHRLVGRPVSTIAPSPDEALVQRDQHQKALDGQEVTWVWPVGSGRWVRSHVAPLCDDAGIVIGAAGFWRDETAVMRAREDEDRRWNRFRDDPGRPPDSGVRGAPR